MKALTIKQPWASLIMECGKDVENRSWSTSFRGRVAIHSSKKPDPREWIDAVELARHAGVVVPKKVGEDLAIVDAILSKLISKEDHFVDALLLTAQPLNLGMRTAQR